MTNERKEAFLAEAARIYDEILTWNGENAKGSPRGIQSYSTGSLGELEYFLRGKRLALVKHLLKDAFEVRAERQALNPPNCPSCGLKMTYEESRTRSIETLEGEVKFERAYYSCRSCGQWTSPLDRQLGLSRCSWSEGIQKGIAALGVSLSFQKAAELFKDLTGVWISSTTAYRITHGKGKKLGSEQERENAI